MVQQKINIVNIYSPSSCSKPIWISSAGHKRRYFEKCR